MILFNQHAARLNLRVIQYPLDVLYRCARQLGRIIKCDITSIQSPESAISDKLCG
jgi:hypothetical protein